MEKSIRKRRRSQLAAVVIIIIALIGVLVVNTDRATAVRTASAGATDRVQRAETAAGEETPGFFSSVMPSLLRLASALVIVVAAIYLGVYGLKKMMGKKYSGNRQLNLLEVLETTYIAPKKSVSLVRVADKAVLVGMSDSQITVLTELDTEETKRVLASLSSVEVEPDAFRTVFKAASKKIKEFTLKRNDKTALETPGRR